MQKILYLQGLIKYVDFKTKRLERKRSMGYDPNEKSIINNEEATILQEALVSLNKSLSINLTMNFNHFKTIFIYILISKCLYYLEDYNEAINKLKEGMLKIADLNKFIFESSEEIDPRVMFISNGMIIERLLYTLAKINEKIGKKKLSAWTFNKLMEITYFRSNGIHRKACKMLKKFLYEDNQFRMGIKNIVSKLLLEKMSNRYENSNKKIKIIISENLLGQFSSCYELKEMLLKCINKYISQNDLISYFQFDSNITSRFDLIAKYYNIRNFQSCPKFCRFNGGINQFTKIKTNFYLAVNEAVKVLIEDEKDSNRPTLDKYIFIFLYAEDFRFNSEEENKDLTRLLIENNITFYVFLFDDNVTDKKLTNIKKYLKDIVEGYLIHVKNFEIIEQAFQNISLCAKNKNILDSNYDNFKYIY
jgi:hypothetical protein